MWNNSHRTKFAGRASAAAPWRDATPRESGGREVRRFDSAVRGVFESPAAASGKRTKRSGMAPPRTRRAAVRICSHVCKLLYAKSRKE